MSILVNIEDLLSRVVNEKSNEEDNDQVNDQVISIIEFCKTPKSRQEILAFIGLKNHSDNFKNHILPMIEHDWIEYTIKDNLKDRNQKYQITPKGISVLKKGKTTK